MDELEFMGAYQDAIKSVERIAAPETKTALMLVLELVSSLNERVSEMQESQDEDELDE